MRPARNALSTLAFCFALALALLPVLPLGCGGGAAESEADTAARATPEPEAPLSGPEGKESSGWRWSGNRRDCFFRFRNHCYDRLEAACRAAGCGESKCSHDDGAPAVVSCRR